MRGLRGSVFLLAALLVAVACKGSLSAGTRLPAAEPVAVRAGAKLPAYVQEVAADDALGHWRLERAGDSRKPRMRLGGAGDLGGREFTAELWAKPGTGNLLSYAKDDFVLSSDRTLKISVLGTELDTGASLEGEGWQHVAVSWDGQSGAVALWRNGERVWTGSAGAGKELPDGELVVGKYDGELGDVAWYDHVVGPGRLQSHVMVDRGLREPTPLIASLPVEFRPQSGKGGPINEVIISPDANLAASASGNTIKIWHLALGKQVFELRGHRDDVKALAYDPAARYLASGSEDGGVFLWDVYTGKRVHELRGHQGEAMAVAFSPDGKRLLTGGYDKSARIWDVRSGKLQQTLEAHPRYVNTLGFSPDSTLAITGSRDSTVRVWKVADGSRVHNVKLPSESLVRVGFDPTGRRFFGASEKDVQLWDTSSGKPAFTVDWGGSERRLADIAFAPSGDLIAGGGGRTIKLWDAANGRLKHELRGHDKVIGSIAWGPDGDTLASTGLDGTVRTWSAPGFKSDGSYGGHDGGVEVLRYSPDGRHLVSGGRDSVLIVREAKSGIVEHDLREESLTAGTVAYDPKRARVVIGDRRDLRVWDLATLKMVRKLDGHDKYVLVLEYSPDGRWLMSRGGRTIKIWDAANFRLVREIRASGGDINVASWSPNSRFVAASTAGHVIRIWEASSGRVVHELAGHSEMIYEVAWSRDGRRLASGGGRTPSIVELKVWDLGTGNLLRDLTGHKRKVRDLEFSPDGRSIASAGDDKEVRIWDASSGRAVKRLKHKRSVYSISWNRDGKLLMAGGDNGELVLWDARSGRKLRELGGHTRTVREVAWSRDGRRAISGSEDGTVRLWRMPKGELERDFGGRRSHSALKLSGDGRFAISGSGAGVKLWEMRSGQALTLASRGDRWLAYTDDGLFDASPNGATLVAAGQGPRVFGIDQLALRNNRPDLIMQRFGFGDAALHGHFKARHDKRLAKAGITQGRLTDTIALPHARLRSDRRPAADGKLVVSYDLRDHDGLKRYQIFANDVPVFAGGKAAKGKRLRGTETIVLTKGVNKIELSALNVHGQESLRSQITVRHEDSTPPDLYVLAFGVSKYKRSKINLQFAHKDAEDLARVLGRAKGFGRVRVKSFVNAQATVANVKAAKAFVDNARPRDTFVLFMAGHGKHDGDAAATYYFLTHEADPNNLAGTAASYAIIEDLLTDVGARHKLFLLDTCESGESDKSVESAAFKAAGSRGLVARAIRGLEFNPHKGKQRPTVRPWVKDRDRFIYVDLSRRSGAIVFSSSRGDEFSYEKAELQNGVFTEEIIEALTSRVADNDRNAVVGTDELRSYVERAVPKRTGDMQHPTVDRDNIHQKFGFPIISR